MKRKIVFKLFVCILVVISMSQTSQYVFAHSSSQEDILATEPKIAGVPFTISIILLRV